MKKYKKIQIPNALRQQVWLHYCGEQYKRKCFTSWCKNIISVFDFHCGHNIPEVRGGKTTIDNLIPLCVQCNLSMGHHYTFTEWCARFKESTENSDAILAKRNWKNWFCRCFWQKSIISTKPAATPVAVSPQKEISITTTTTVK